ncbi:DegV family protein [Guggenheimella bovis]
MYTIIGDTSLDTTLEMHKRCDIRKVPFSIRFDHTTYVDRPDVSMDDFLTDMKNSKTFQSACPSPQDYITEFETASDEVYVITISSHLSGSYNSAVLAKNLFESEGTDKKIHIIDSKSAASGLTLLALMIMDLKDQGKSFKEIIEEVEAYTDQIGTLFVLKSLNNLRKAGRLSNLKAFLATTLNIVPVMCGNDGVIEVAAKVRGSKKAYQTMLDLMEEKAGNLVNRMVTLNHMNYLEKALELKASIEARFPVREVVILEAGLLNTLYEDEQGIIIAF